MRPSVRKHRASSAATAHTAPPSLPKRVASEVAHGWVTTATPGGAQGHGRQVLGLIDHHMAIAATATGGERVGLIEQWQVGGRPRLLSDLLGRGPLQEAAVFEREKSVDGLVAVGRASEKEPNNLGTGEVGPDFVDHFFETVALAQIGKYAGEVLLDHASIDQLLPCLSQ